MNKNEQSAAHVAWGEVELFRQQHCNLPSEQDGDISIDYPTALEKAAYQVMAGGVNPYNAATMMLAAADEIRRMTKP